MKNENIVVFFLNMLKKKFSKNIGIYVYGFNRDNIVFCLYN